MIFSSAHVRRVDARGGAWQGALKWKDGAGWHTKTKMLGDAKVSEREAKRRLAEWRAEAERELDGRLPDSMMTVGDYCADYIDTLERSESVERSTVSDYRCSLGRIGRGLSGVRMCDLTAGRVQAWEKALLDDGLSPSTVAKTHRFLKQVCGHAVAVDDLAKNPLLAVKPPRRPRARPNALDKASVAGLLRVMSKLEPTPVVTAATMALLTGMRRGEVCGLRWSDVDLEERVIHVGRSVGIGRGGTYVKEPKTAGSVRSIPFGDVLYDALMARAVLMREECEEAGQRLTPAHYVIGYPDGGYANPTALGKLWNDKARELRLVGTEGRQVTFHDLRHTFATVLVSSKVDIKTVSALMGHASAAMTLDVYADALPDAKRAAVAALDTSVSKAGSIAGLFS